MGIDITPEQIELLAYLPESYLQEESGAWRIVANDIAFLVVGTIVFAMYITSRYLHDGARGIETRFLLPLAYISNVGLWAGGPYAVQQAGAGYHVLALVLRDPVLVTRFLQIQTATEPLWIVAITCSKLAILVLYIRVFTSRWVRLGTWFTMGFIMLNFIAFILASFLICRPFAMKWDPSLPGTCGDIQGAYKWVSLPNIISDVAILLLPLSSLYRLQMRKAQKVSLAFTFLIGSMGIVAAIYRLVTFFETDMTQDPTFLSTKTAVATDAEAGAYFLCACLPGLRPLFVRASKTIKSSKFFSTYVKTTSRSGSEPRIGEKPGSDNAAHPRSAPYINTMRFTEFGTSSERVETVTSEEFKGYSGSPYHAV